MTLETITLGESVIVGLAVGIYYDLFRILRRVFRFGYTTIIFQDVFFWLTSAIGVFFATIWFNNGYVRIYFVLAALVSAVLYCLTLGSVIVWVFGKASELIKRACGRVYSAALKPLSVKFVAGWKKIRENHRKTSQNVKKNRKTA